jgi:hypothetical protein
MVAHFFGGGAKEAVTFGKNLKIAMAKRVRITNDGLNDYGGRVLTSGMDISRYEKNPVLLYMHNRGQVIGCLKDIKREGDAITAELDFDEVTELSKQCKKQWDYGSLKAVSVGIDILEMSDETQYIMPGQTAATVTKCRLYEVSLVDIGSNEDALVLRKDGKLVTLGKGSNPLPSIKTQNRKEMDIKTLAHQLGLPETADEAAVTAKIDALLAAEKSNAELLKAKTDLELSAITGVVEAAIGEKKIGADKKEQFVKLGQQVGIETLKATFGAMSAQVKLTQAINPEPGVVPERKSYAKLSEVPTGELEKLRATDSAEYKRLYKAEYGMECEI